MYLLYLDEFGHDGIWDPSQPNHRHHPLFGLAGVAVPGNKARDLDRGYLRLKERFYAYEIGEAVKQGKRRERFEPKQLSSRRDFIFSMEVVNLVRRLDGHVFAQGVSKVVAKKTGHWLYNTVAGRMLVAFERYLRSRGGFRDGCGVIVLDRRDEVRDVKLLGSVQSFLFSSSPTVSARAIRFSAARAIGFSGVGRSHGGSTSRPPGNAHADSATTSSGGREVDPPCCHSVKFRRVGLWPRRRCRSELLGGSRRWRAGDRERSGGLGEHVGG